MPGSYLKGVKSDTFYGKDSLKIDEIKWDNTEDLTAALNRYRAGELDMTETVPARQIAWLREYLPEELHISPYLGSYVFGFNTTQPPFRDAPKLRKALALALDRDILTSKISGAGELPAYSWVPPVSGYTQQVPDWAHWTQAERNKEAQRLYAEAGYSKDHPLRMQLRYNTESCLLYTSPSPRDRTRIRMPSSA